MATSSFAPTTTINQDLAHYPGALDAATAAWADSG